MSCGIKINPLVHMTQGILLRMTNIFIKWLLEQMVKHFGEIPLEIRALAEPVQLAPISTSQYGGGSERCVCGGRERMERARKMRRIMETFREILVAYAVFWMLVTSMGC